MIERLGTPDADLQHVADNWQAEWIMVHDALIRALVRLAQERSDAEALRDELEAQTARSLTTWVADKMLTLGWMSPDTAVALQECNEALERERDILKAYSDWAKERIRASADSGRG